MVGNVSESLQALLASTIDYAGLFPPSSLDLACAVQNYREYRHSAEVWMLGAFVIPAGKLAQLEALIPPDRRPWPVSALVSSHLAEELAGIERFNASGVGRVEWLEAKVSTAEQLLAVRERVPRRYGMYFEAPPGELAILKAVRDSGSRAKIRTGGLTPEAIPAAAQVASFLEACSAQQIAFKATAGLHHPLRCVHALTYEENSPRAVMHGFLNVLFAMVFSRIGVSREELVEILEATALEEFHVDPDGITWRYHRATNQQIRESRQNGMVSFGSCSFTEPVSDLRTCGLL